MSDTIELRGFGDRVRRQWWVVAIPAIIGAVLAVVVSGWIAPVHRAQGTLLVGPINGTVTKSTTLRASEDLAVFYADLARRQVVLGPVAAEQQPPISWEDLRNGVSAVIPDQNPRAVTVTVTDTSKERAVAITVAIIRRLIALSPAPSGETEQGFISEQVASLRASIKQAEVQVDHLKVTAAQETDPVRRKALAQEWSAREAQLDEWRQTYVEMMAVDPTSDAGGLQVLDDVTTVTSLDRAGTARQGVLGGLVGAALGLLVIWSRSGLGGSRRDPAAPSDEEGDPGAPEMFATTRQRQAGALPSDVGSSHRVPR